MDKFSISNLSLSSSSSSSNTPFGMTFSTGLDVELLESITVLTLVTLVFTPVVVVFKNNSAPLEGEEPDRAAYFFRRGEAPGG